MRFARFAFGSIEVDEMTYEHDLIGDGKRVCKRRKAPSKPFRPRFGHTPRYWWPRTSRGTAVA